MPIMVRFEEAGPKLEAGTYEMTCVRVKEDWLENSPYGDGHVVKITLQTTDVMGPDGMPVELEAMASFKFTPAAKLTGWLNALGVAFEPGIEFDLETAPISHRCLAKIEIDDRGDKGEWNKVADLMAPPRAQRVKSEALAPEDEPPENALSGATSPVEADSKSEQHYHPAAKPGEPIVDASEPLTGTVVAASQAALDYIDRLLTDVGMDGKDMRQELDIAVPMSADDARRAVVWLEERKKAVVRAS